MRADSAVKVIIRKKDGVLWEGDALSLSSVNQVGPFDILPQHTHFIGLVEQYLVVRIGKQEKRWEIERGVLSVRDGVAEVFLGY